MRIIAKTTSLTIIAGSLLAALPAAAQGLQILPDACVDKGGTGAPPGLDCVIETLVSVGRVLFGLAGSFALLMFVIGGFMYLSSAGADDKVKKGKEYIKNAVIGLIIILTSAYFIEYGANALRRGENAPACTGTVYTQNGEPACCKGVVVTVATGSAAGTQKCMTGTGENVCQSVDPGYTCEDITSRADQGANCIRGLCPGNDNVRCCPLQSAN